MLPSLARLGRITEENFVGHLGEEKYVSCPLGLSMAPIMTPAARYYHAYLAFFAEYLLSHSPTETLERFIFSPAYNFTGRSEFVYNGSDSDSREKRQPEMLNRLLSGLLHPFIQLAYGLEFGILGLVAQGMYPAIPHHPDDLTPRAGLAQAAVHPKDQPELIPLSCFTSSAADTADADLSDLTRRLEKAGFEGLSSASVPEKRPTFAFHRRIHEDPAFNVELPADALRQFETVVKSAGSAIHDLVQEWTKEWLSGTGTRGGPASEAQLRGMVEEVVVGNVIWYGVGGRASRGTSGRAFNADFFMYAFLRFVRPRSG